MTAPTTDLTETIATNAALPASTTIDGLTVTHRSVNEQIAADKHVANKRATATTRLGAVFRKLVPPGGQ